MTLKESRLLLMRCGRLSVEGEGQEISRVSPRATKPRRRRGKKSSSNNPYSNIGLDKFASLNAELSAKRESVAKKTGIPESLVRFSYSNKEWIPVVIKNGKEGAPGVSILPPIKPQQKKHNSTNNQDNEAKAEMDSENDVSGYESQAVVPWTGYLMTTVFGVLTVNAILVRKFAVPAAAMAVLMVLCALQRRWEGGVMCMKRFTEVGISYFSQLFFYWKKVSEIKIVPSSNKKGGLLCLSAPTSPVKYQFQQPTVFSWSSEIPDMKSQQEDCKCDKKWCGRIVSMDCQPRRAMRLLQHSENFQRWKRVGGGSIDCSVGGIVMIIILFFLVFYGRFWAICFTCAWWYVLPNLRTEGNEKNMNSTSSFNRCSDGEDRKEVIMD